jgi:site-specific recombinase XerC
MTPSLAVFAVTLLVAVGFAFFLLRAQRRAVAEKIIERTVRTPSHERHVRMVREWLEDRRIARVLVDQRHLSDAGRQSLLANLEALDEQGALQAVAFVVQPHQVRHAIALHMERHHGADRYEAMKMLQQYHLLYEKPRRQA